MRKEFLLGVKENEIILGEIEITNRNGYKEFSASFDQGTAFNIEDVDNEYKENYFEDYWNSVDAETKLSLLEDGDLTKSEVMDNWNEADYHDFIDCSCTDDEIDLTDGSTINFETTSCGQYDCREDENFSEMIFTNKKAFDLIMELWDNYHLKNVENVKDFDEKINKINELLKNYEFYSTDSEKFIKENIEL